MSNNRNLGNIATAITNATSGQVLTSQGNGVATFADAGGTGVTVHTNQAAMLTDAASADEGSLHYENDNNKLYVKQSSGFFLLASITNTAPTVSGFTETTGGGSANTILDNGTFTLTSGSNTVITLTATDPDLETLVYSATVTSGTASNVISSPSLPISNQSGNTFTLTPVTSGTGGTITIRFDVSDGNNVVNKTHSFSIVFQIVDSNHTTLLATATSTGGNSTIEDSSTANSGSGHSITVNGDTYAGSFSPYRSGGYSTYFDGNGDWLELTGTALGNGNFTVEAWVWLDSLKDYNVIYDDRATGSSATGLALGVTATGAPYLYTNNGFQITSSQTCTAKKWHHVSLVRSSGVITLYLDGTSGGTYSSSANFTNTNLGIGVARTYTVTSQFSGYMRDVRAVVGTAITPPSGGPTERLEAVTNTSLLTCHLPYNDHSITVNGNVSTKPFSPYDYEEYDAADHGGSVYFDGTTDYIEHQGTFTLPTGTNANWTIECWVNLNQINLNQGILRVSSTAANGNNDDIYFSEQGGYLYTSCKGGGIASTTTNFKMYANTWHHIAMVKNSGTVYLYNNGVYCGSVSDSNDYSGNYYVYGGLYYSSSYCFAGYLSDFKISNSAIYTTGTSNFTPPTAPLSSSGASLHLKGTDASIIDKSQSANLKLVGDTTGSTDQVRTGNWANTKTMKFDGSDDYISLDANNDLFDFSYGNGDFTIEGWFYFNSLPTSASNAPKLYIDIDSSTAYWQLYLLPDGLTLRANNTGIYITESTITWSTNTWYHISLSRSASTYSVHVDGDRVINTTTTHQIGNHAYKTIGGTNLASAQSLNGYIQDFRITRGLARYTAADETSNIPSAPLEG